MNVLDHILHLCIDLDPCFLVVDNKCDQDSRLYLSSARNPALVYPRIQYSNIDPTPQEGEVYLHKLLSFSVKVYLHKRSNVQD